MPPRVEPPTLTVVRLYRALERASGDCALSLPQYRILGLLADGTARASNLAARLSVTKPTVTALLDGLVDRGYVTREAATTDRRAITVAITDAGRAAVTSMDDALREHLDEIVGRCPDPDAVYAALSQLAGALDVWFAEQIARAAR